MKRRDFLKKAGLGAAAVAATTVNAPAVLAQKKYSWKMVTTWPPGLPVLQTGCERLAKRVGEMSDGRLQIQVFAAANWYRLWKAFKPYPTVRWKSAAAPPIIGPAKNRLPSGFRLSLLV
jgi:TRAP-type mannitol/chloroaromatic compound transport system substrate-binding protein